MIPFDEARAYVLGGCEPLAPSHRPIGDALGCVLAEPVVSAEAVPPFDNTAVDGFAVRAIDVAGASEAAPVTLQVIGTIPAGTVATEPLRSGTAYRIMTGAPIPPGADAVVMVERTAPAGDDAVRVFVEPGHGAHIRPAGDDLRPGTTVFDPGDELTAAHLGVLATVGIGDVATFPRARVGVFSTGDELVDGPGPLGPGQIRDSNRIALRALVAQAGAEAVDLGRVADEPDLIAAAIADGAERCDALLTTGGVSMGDRDYVKVVLDRLGDMRWMQVAIKPAKPLAFGTVAGPDARRIPVFGLPGNPVSSLVSFELFARPGLRRMMGHPDGRLDRPRVQAVCDDGLGRRADGKTHFVRVRCTWEPDDRSYHVTSAGAQGSHQLAAMARADALAVLPDGDGVRAGAPVDVLLLGPSR